MFKTISIKGFKRPMLGCHSMFKNENKRKCYYLFRAHLLLLIVYFCEFKDCGEIVLTRDEKSNQILQNFDQLNFLGTNKFTLRCTVWCIIPMIGNECYNNIAST